MSGQPIDTYYDGYWFRSRTEARWAVFWKTLGLPFEYEVEGYDLGEIWYLPDYYIPAWKMFVEIKAGAPDECEIRKCELLHRELGNCVLLLCGQPWHGDYKALLFDDEALAQSYGEQKGPRYFEGVLLGCERCDCITFVEEDASGNQGLYSGFGHANPTCKFGKCIDREAVFTDSLQRAFEAAREGRFEFTRPSERRAEPKTMNIIDVISNATRIEENLIVIPSKIQKIIMVRVSFNGDPIGQVCVVGEIGDNRYILVEQGRLSYDGGAGGIANINDFRQWLDNHDLIGRVEKSLRSCLKTQNIR